MTTVLEDVIGPLKFKLEVLANENAMNQERIKDLEKDLKALRGIVFRGMKKK